MIDQKIGAEDYLQRFSTKVLWHFTGYSKSDDEAFKILVSIVQQRQLNTSKNNIPVRLSSNKAGRGDKISCMCDIPFKDLRIHTSRYGKFGIAFKKENAIKNGLFNPVWYFHYNHPLFEYSTNLIESIDNIIKEWNESKSLPRNLEQELKKLSESLSQHFFLNFTYLKVSDLTRNVELSNVKLDESQRNNFYYEREWRSYKPWDFEWNDVIAIMVKDTSYIEKLNKVLGDSGNTNLKISPNIPILTYDLIGDL